MVAAGLIGLLVLGVIGVQQVRGGDAPAAQPTQTVIPQAAVTAPPTTVAAEQIEPAACMLEVPEVSVGDTGTDVECAQRALRAAGVMDADVSGTFDEVTQAATRSFQAEVGLFVDGIIGKNTATELGIWPGAEAFIVRTPEPAPGAVDLIGMPHRWMTGKNSADIRMVVDAMDVILSKPHVDTFALVTGDSDFVPLVSKLREHKWVMGLGVKAATSKLLLHSCDEYVFYEELEGLSAPKPTPARSRSGRQPKASDRKSEAFDLLKRTVRGLNRRHDTVWSSMIKQTIMRKIPSFSESSYGYATFGEMLQAAVDAKVLEAERDRKTGNWRVIGVQE